MAKGLFVTFLIIFFSSSAPAFAYLDPGTGSMLLQGLIGTIAAVATAGSLYWHRIKMFFSKKTDPKNTGE